MKCSVALPFKDARSAASALGAILPEQRSVPSRRTKVDITKKGREIHLHISSEDVTSMRATVNSYLRWFILAKRVTEMAGDG